MNLQERMQNILNKFNKLKKQDKKFEVDGADEHKYKFDAVLTEEKIQQYETKNKLKLPEDFRWMLLNMGNGGVGPKLNCWGLHKIVNDDFPLKYGEMYSMNEFEEEYEEFDDACKAINVASEKAAKGQITIGYDTDHAELNLVLKGEAAGTVWSIDFGTDSYGAYPVTSPYRDGEAMTFADWFEIWLDEALEGGYPEYSNYIEFDDCKHISIPEDEFNAYKTKVEKAEKEKQAKQKKEEESNPVTLSFDEWVIKMDSLTADKNIGTTEKVLQLIESGQLACNEMQQNYVRNSLIKKLRYWMGTSLCKKTQYPVLRDKLIEQCKKALTLLPYPAPENDTLYTFKINSCNSATHEESIWNKEMYMRAANLFAWYTYETKGDLNEALRTVESALIYQYTIKLFNYYCIYDTQVRILLALDRKEEAYKVVDYVSKEDVRGAFYDLDDFKKNAEFLAWQKNQPEEVVPSIVKAEDFIGNTHNSFMTAKVMLDGSETELTVKFPKNKTREKCLVAMLPAINKALNYYNENKKNKEAFNNNMLFYKWHIDFCKQAGTYIEGQPYPNTKKEFFNFIGNVKKIMIDFRATGEMDTCRKGVSPILMLFHSCTPNHYGRDLVFTFTRDGFFNTWIDFMKETKDYFNDDDVANKYHDITDDDGNYADENLQRDSVIKKQQEEYREKIKTGLSFVAYDDLQSLTQNKNEYLKFDGIERHDEVFDYIEAPVKGIYMSASKGKFDLSKIQKLKMLEYFEINNFVKIDGNDFKQLPNLKHVVIYWCKKFANILSLLDIPTLEHIHFNCCDNLDREAFLAEIKKRDIRVIIESWSNVFDIKFFNAPRNQPTEPQPLLETKPSTIYNLSIGNAWDDVLRKEFEADYFKKLQTFLDEEYKSKTIYPQRENIFNALKFSAPDKVRVVILGQDPYINEGQAHGFALSVLPGVTPPPSLKNMYKELESDLGIPVSKSGHLIKWAEQGVLLLNTVLTVEAGKSNSHAKKGWEKFTDAVFAYLGASDQPIVFMLWGKPAQTKEKFITGKSHCIIKSPHPSPLSASTGFFGSKPYSQANAFLKEKGLKEIDWRVE